MNRSESSRTGPSVTGLLWSRFILRHWRREPILTATLAGILALGVAVFLSVRLANKAAVSGFTLFTESISGQSDFILRSGTGDLPGAILRELRETTGTLPVDFFPVLELPGVFPGEEETGLLRVIGVDLVAIGNALGQSGAAGTATAPAADEEGGSGFGDREAAFVGPAFARVRQVAKGDRIRPWIGEAPVDLRLAGILPDPANRPAIPENLILMDLPALQDQASRPGRLSRIEIRFPAGIDADENRRDASERLLAFARARGLVLETPEDRKATVTRMSAGFRLNLTILSGLALLVGVYLIMQAMEAAVTKRRGEIAVLRSLGVTPRQIHRVWLAEAAVLGAAGGVLGIVLGRLLASGMVGGIAATVNALYYETTTRAVSLHPGETAFSLVFGITASLVAAWIPAREAASVAPAQALRSGERGGGMAFLQRWPWGLALLAAAVLFALLPPVKGEGNTAFPLGGYLAALAAVLGGSVFLGRCFGPIARFLGRSGNDAMRSYAASRLKAAGGRHRLTAAGLSTAIGMSAAMAILVASFEETLTSWIGQLLKADLYVAAPGAASVANGNAIAEADWKRLLALPGIDGGDLLQRREVEFEGRSIVLGGASYHDDPERHLQLLWLDPPDARGPDALRGRVGENTPAWVSEPFARRFGRGKGDRVSVPTPAGPQEVTIEGVYADYGNESGTLLVQRETMEGWFGDRTLSNLALYLSPGQDPERILESIRSAFPSLVVRTNGRLRDESIRLFHQTFAVTYALEAIAVFIAVGGLGLALTGLLLERKNELAILRSLGATRRDIARAATWEGTGIAAAGLAGGLAVSFFLGWILIGVINPQTFGWTLRYDVPWTLLVLLSGLTLGAAAVVSRVVGLRNANLKSDREE
jgi:putative ABC transport system permease protein